MEQEQEQSEAQSQSFCGGENSFIQNMRADLRDGRGYHGEEVGVCSFWMCVFLSECVARLKESTAGVL